jgi:hypothetical protein
MTKKTKTNHDENGSGAFMVKIDKNKIKLLIHNNHVVAEMNMPDVAENEKDMYTQLFENVAESLGGRIDFCSKCGFFLYDEPRYYIDGEMHCENCFKTRTKSL